MKKHFEYFKYVLRHKWWVLVAGIHAEVSLWRLIKHDWSKFLPSEWIPYANYFYGASEEKRIEDRTKRLMELQVVGIRTARILAKDEIRDELDDLRNDFNLAWLKHINRNDHHWQHWLLVRDKQDFKEQRYQIKSIEDGVSSAILTCDNFNQWKLLTELSINEDNEDLKNLIHKANALVPLRMDIKAIREMAADWAGAGKAITGKWEFLEWYSAHKNEMIIEPYTRQLVEIVLMLIKESMVKQEQLKQKSIWNRIKRNWQNSFSSVENTEGN